MIGVFNIVSVHVAITLVCQSVVCVVENNLAQRGDLLGDVARGVVGVVRRSGVGMDALDEAAEVVGGVVGVEPLGVGGACELAEGAYFPRGHYWGTVGGGEGFGLSSLHSTNVHGDWDNGFTYCMISIVL